MKEEFVPVLSQKVSDEFGTDVIYIKFKCRTCENTWGVTVNEGTVSKTDLICRECAKKFYLEQMWES